MDLATEEAVRRFLALIDDRYDVAEVIVFGSRARGTHRQDSDADVAVLLRGPSQRALPVALDMADVAFEVLLLAGVNISPLPIWLEQWEQPDTHANPNLLRNIEKDGVRLWVKPASDSGKTYDGDYFEDQDQRPDYGRAPG